MSHPCRSSPMNLQDGMSGLSATHRVLTNLIDELKCELGASLAPVQDDTRSAYIGMQRLWEASASRQREIVQQLPLLLLYMDADQDPAQPPDPAATH